MPKQVIIAAEHAEVFRLEVRRELSYAAQALATRVDDGFGQIALAQARLRAAEDLYSQAHEQEGQLVVDVNEALCGTLPFVIETVAGELRDPAYPTHEAIDQMRERVDSIAYWMGVVEQLRDEIVEHGEVARESQKAEAVR